MLDPFHNQFVPEAVKHDGYMRVKLLKRRTVLQGTAPPLHNYRFELEFESQEQRQRWIASPGHQRVWPPIERSIETKGTIPSCCTTRCSSGHHPDLREDMSVRRASLGLLWWPDVAAPGRRPEICAGAGRGCRPAHRPARPGARCHRPGQRRRREGGRRVPVHRGPLGVLGGPALVQRCRRERVASGHAGRTGGGADRARSRTFDRAGRVVHWT